MHHILGVDVLQRLDDLVDNTTHCALLRTEEFAECFFWDVLCYHKDVIRVSEAGVQLDDVRMIQLGEDRNLIQQLTLDFVLLDNRFEYLFNCVDSPCPLVNSLKHLPELPLTQQPT